MRAALHIFANGQREKKTEVGIDVAMMRVSFSQSEIQTKDAYKLSDTYKAGDRSVLSTGIRAVTAGGA